MVSFAISNNQCECIHYICLETLLSCKSCPPGATSPEKWPWLGLGGGLWREKKENIKCKDITMDHSKFLNYMRKWARPGQDESKLVMHSLRCKIKVSFGHKLRYKIKVKLGENSVKLCPTNWNVVKNNVNVLVDELPSQTIVYTCLIIDIWTRRCWRSSTRFYAFQSHLPKMTGFQWNWHQKFLTLLWTPLARQKALSESYATHAVSC